MVSSAEMPAARRARGPGRPRLPHAPAVLQRARALSGFDAGPLESLLEKWGYNVVLVASALLCPARAALVRSERMAWLTLGGCLLAWAVGNVYYTVVLWGMDPIPIPSPATSCGSSSNRSSTRRWRCSCLELGLSGQALDHVRQVAEPHDVGKVAVPSAILDKPGPLDPQEWTFIARHTIIGERILAAAPALRGVGRLVRASHERYDGGGYRDGLCGDDIPLGARIAAVCDAYDAMTTDRPYRAAMSQANALAELGRCAGSQFDPAVVGRSRASPPGTRRRALAGARLTERSGRREQLVAVGEQRHVARRKPLRQAPVARPDDGQAAAGALDHSRAATQRLRAAGIDVLQGAQVDADP
jgi:hypothetical protein